MKENYRQLHSRIERTQRGNLLFAIADVALDISEGVHPGFVGKMQKSTNSGNQVRQTGGITKP